MDHYYNNVDGWFTFPELYKNVVKHFSDKSHFVEVGTWLGKSAVFMAVEILNSNKKIKFDCVDTWQGSDEHKSMEKIVKNSLYNDFLKNIEPVKNIITPVRMKSLDAAPLYEDQSLDFVFIDASHEYEDVVNDINAWYPKVKSGGILAGHDYGPAWLGVVQAVNEFLIKEQYKLTINSELCWGITKK
jgi:hypothetical protein